MTLSHSTPRACRLAFHENLSLERERSSTSLAILQPFRCRYRTSKTGVVSEQGCSLSLAYIQVILDNIKVAIVEGWIVSVSGSGWVGGLLWCHPLNSFLWILVWYERFDNLKYIPKIFEGELIFGFRFPILFQILPSSFIHKNDISKIGRRVFVCHGRDEWFQ